MGLPRQLDRVQIGREARAVFDRLRRRYPNHRSAGEAIGISEDVIVQLDNDGAVRPSTARRVTAALLAYAERENA